MITVLTENIKKKISELTRSRVTNILTDDMKIAFHYITFQKKRAMSVRCFSLMNSHNKQLRRKVTSLCRAITLHIPLHYCVHDLPKSRRWNINFPANRPVIMASIQHTTFRMFHPRLGYLLNRREKQLPTTIIWASV